MTLWTTFCPGKIIWELTAVTSKGNSAMNQWLSKKDVIEDSLKLLKRNGISGIRLVVYPSEITQNGKAFDWKPIDTMLDLAKKYKLEVDLCIGPFQYPNYPGIYLPQQLLQYVFDNHNALDTVKALSDYGMDFLEKQLERYDGDKRVTGYHFANEWPDHQNVAGKESVKGYISAVFMLRAAKYLKSHTKKPISLNTNIDASNKKRLTAAFSEVLTELQDQANLGFDIYPSQETWRKAPLQKLIRIFEPYTRAFHWSQNHFKLCTMYFCEVEAQPWGNGQSWFKIISNEADPEQKVLTYANNSLEKTWNKHIKGTTCPRVSLWGADFWLSANAMGITWPLATVKQHA
jgi:hypothetical protein